MKIGTIAAFLFTICVATSFAFSQALSDTTIIFQPVNPEVVQKSGYTPLLNAWGFDLMVSNNGFGAGVFYRREFDDDLAGFINFGISDVKDEAEFERFDIYGNSFVYGKKNRLLLFPLIAGIQYRLFKDDIVENFRPYLTAGLGPSMVYVAPYSNRQVLPLPGGGTYTTDEQIEFFTSMKYGQARYTLGAFVGIGAYFGMEKGSLSGINLRYYLVRFPDGIEVMYGGFIRNFGGFYITLNFGSLY